MQFSLGIGGHGVHSGILTINARNLVTSLYRRLKALIDKRTGMEHDGSNRPSGRLREGNRHITKGCTRSTHSGGCAVVSFSFVPGEPRRYVA